MARGDNKNIAKNTVMLFIMNMAKMIFPLISLPYLTRVLSTDSYGVVAYVRTVMLYMQMLIDFGFLYSATKDIVKAGDDFDEVGKITGDSVAGKIFLSIIGLVILFALTICIPILNTYKMFTFLSYVVVVLMTFMMDFLFRGLEKMHVITVRFVLMKTISTALTFVFVKSDSDILWIPILDILGTIFALMLVFAEIKKLNIRIKVSGLKDIAVKLKESAVYFISDMAGISFNGFCTIVIGILLTKTDIAYWSVCIQVVSAAQAMYSPITNGVYPAMVQRKEIKLLIKELMIFMPLILIGCVACYFLSPIGLKILGGEEYVSAVPILRCLIPVMFFAFPVSLFGWSALGAIDKAKQNSVTTVISVLFQVIGLFVLVKLNIFSIISAACVRSLTEMFMCVLRVSACFKYRACFADVSKG